MPERGMAEVVSQADRFRQRLVQAQSQRDRAGDLRHLDRMCHARAVQVPLVIDEHLSLVDQPAKRVRMDDAVAVALKLAAKLRRTLRVAPAAGPPVMRRL